MIQMLPHPDYSYSSVVSKIERLHDDVDGRGSSGSSPARVYDPMDYFKILTHLSLVKGWKLTYLEDTTPDGAPRLIFEKKDRVNVEFKKSGTDWGRYVVLDRTPESLFEFAVLLLLGGQCKLRWHAAYRDHKIIADAQAAQKLLEPGYIGSFAEELEIPKVPENETECRIFYGKSFDVVSFLTFTKWGGYYLNEFRMGPNFRAKASMTATLVERYVCGVLF